MMSSQLTITSVMEYADKIHADAELVSVTQDNPAQRYTYKDAFKRVRQLANVLSDFDLKKGDRIATLAWNDHRHFELYYAISCSGYVCHTINPRLYKEQISFILDNADDQVLFIDPMFVPLLAQFKQALSKVKGIVVLTDREHMPESSDFDLLCYEDLLAKAKDEFAWPDLNENDASFLCYTSGTTGNPKGVLYTHRSLVLHSYACIAPDCFGFSTSSVMLVVVPMFHVNAWGIPFSAIMAGTKLVLPGPKMADGEALTSLINNEQVSLAAGVPTIWAALLNYLNESNSKVPTLKNLTVGGAACPISIMQTFEEKYGVYTNCAWGMTETSPLGTFNNDLNKADIGEDEYQLLRVKAGRPPYGVQLKIVNEKGDELPWDGEAFGKLLIRGPWVCSEYFATDDTSSFTDDGWFDTGDVATIDEHGLMQITDRSKDMIKSGGEWISSIDIENIVAGHKAVQECAVIGVPNDKWGERPLLVVVRKEGSQVPGEEILSWLSSKVAKWWVPDACEFVDEIPHTATGKVSKKDLRAKFMN